MKKEYIKPTVKTVRMRAHSMLAASPGVGEGGSDVIVKDPASKEDVDDIGW